MHAIYGVYGWDCVLVWLLHWDKALSEIVYYPYSGLPDLFSHMDILRKHPAEDVRSYSFISYVCID